MFGLEIRFRSNTCIQIYVWASLRYQSAQMCAGEGRGGGHSCIELDCSCCKGQDDSHCPDGGWCQLSWPWSISLSKLGTNVTILIRICSHFVPWMQILKAHSKGGQSPCLGNKMFPVAVGQVVHFIIFPCIFASWKMFLGLMCIYKF